MSQFDQSSLQQASPSLNPSNWPESVMPNSWLPLPQQVPWGDTQSPQLPFPQRHPIPFPIRYVKTPFSGGMNQGQVCLGAWPDINYGGRPVLVNVPNAGLPNIGFIQYVTLAGISTNAPIPGPATVLFTYNIPQNCVAKLAGVLTGITTNTFEYNFIWSLLYNSQDMLHGQSSSNNLGLPTPNNEFTDYGKVSDDWMTFMAGSTLTFVVSAVNNVGSSDQLWAKIKLALFPLE